MTARATIAQISVSPGGVPKLPVPAARVTELGLEGDAHREMEVHGGPERALCLFALEQIRALQAEGHPVVPGALGENLTIEGLDWHPLVEAFVGADATQCGFCTPGQIVSASALLEANPSPSTEEIKHAMAGNLCRCGTYPKIEHAIHAVAAQKEGN